MQLTVYRQAAKTRPDGTVVYKGEDARPYVDGQLILVADGLGGAAAIRHQKFVPELFDRDRLMDALFEGVFEDYGNETFVRYVTESFYELFAVKDCYTDNINNIKKSGYFASRLVTAIVLHEVLYNGTYGADGLFAMLPACQDEQQRRSCLAAIGGHYRELIGIKLREIAKKVNLIYESSYAGLALLGSTLCATLYRECEDGVEAVYLTAGDSRPYVWSESGGLCQVLADQEGADGGMTNYVKANDGAEFDIRCDYFRFDKPCVLFNATDGCFDSGKFLSPLAFEKTILEAAASSVDTAEMSEQLTSFFVEYGRHDDSSTIAMRLLGYEDYADFQAACRRRLAVLQEQYFDRMEGLLDVDYAAEYEEIQRALPGTLGDLREAFASDPGVLRYCADAILAGRYAPYEEREEPLQTRIAAAREQRDRATAVIADAVASDFARFLSAVGDDAVSCDGGELAKIERIEQEYRRVEREYTDLLERCQAELQSSSATLAAMMDDVRKIGVPASLADYGPLAFGSLPDCQRSMATLFRLLDGLRTRRLEPLRAMMELRQRYAERNRRLADRMPQRLREVCARIVDGSLALPGASPLSPCGDTIETALAQIRQIDEQIAACERERETLLQEMIGSYWSSCYADIMTAVLEDPQYEVEDGLRRRARQMLDEQQAKSAAAEEKSRRQRELFETYDVTYSRYVKERERTDDDPRI